MESPLTNPLVLVLSGLLERAKRAAWPSPEAGFVAHVASSDVELPPILGVGTLEWPRDQRLDHAPSLAAAGYLLAGRATDATFLTAWLACAERLMAKDAFPADRQSFAHRPVELLGIALGARACRAERPKVGEWLVPIVRRAYTEHLGNHWSTALELAAEFTLGTRTSMPSSSPEPALAHEVAAWRWVSRFDAKVRGEPDISRRLLTQVLVEQLPALSAAESIVLYTELRDVVRRTVESEVARHWHVGRPERDAAAVAEQLCRRFHLFAQQLLARHAGREPLRMNDEYDVQDVMHALLKLHFLDVREEEVAPSVGGKSSRMDFLLKRERVVVETKMTRKNLGQKEVSDELIIDMKRYRAHPDCGTLVCLVYDPGRHCPTPAALESDLSGEVDGFRTVVVVCPTGL